MLLLLLCSLFVIGYTATPIGPPPFIFNQSDVSNNTFSSSQNVTNAASTSRWYPRTTTWRPSTSTWYPRTTTWYPRNTTWHPRRTTWYSTSNSWYPTSSSWYPTSSTWSPSPVSKVMCNNYRDLSVKELPAVGDLVCDVGGYYDRYSSYNRYFTRGRPNDLLSRETLVRLEKVQQTDWFSKTVSGTISRVNVLNFGDHHAFVEKITIENDGYRRASVNVRYEIPEGQEVKLFVEIYGREG